jgi:hypothetical protein
LHYSVIFRPSYPETLPDDLKDLLMALLEKEVDKRISLSEIKVH